MKHLLLLLLALVLSVHAQKVLLASSPSNTRIKYPPGAVTWLDPHQNQLRPNYIGFNAKWIWRAVPGQIDMPNNDVIETESQFHSQCSLGTLIITADDQFTASINYGPQYSGNNFNIIYKFPLTRLHRGRNVLRIKARNHFGPAGLIFAITQECQPSHMLRNHE